MDSLEDMLSNSELFKDNVDFGVTKELSILFAQNESPKFEDVKLLVDKLIAQAWNQFAEQTGKKDTRARISDFYNKIYSIKTNPKFQVWMTKSEEGQELYGRVMDLLRSEQCPDPRAYSPERDKRTVIENRDLKQADYDIRKKCFEDIINNNDFDMITSSHLQTLCEVLGDKPKYSIEMYLGRMDMNHAVQMKGILQNLGYSVDLNALLTGNENIIASRIPITNDKRYDKTFQNFELEEMGIPTGFSFEEWKMVQEHDESMENMDRLEAIFSESEIGKRTISRDVKRLDFSQERTNHDQFLRENEAQKE